MQLTRRKLLVLGGVAASVAALPLIFRSRRPQARGLVRDPAKMLDLPPGFTYRVIDGAGEPMSDGYRVPNLPDGMGCFATGRGQLVLLRNHEITRHFGHGAYASNDPPPEAYDKTCFGGVTRVVLDGKTLAKVSNNLVLTGTLKTCGGGSCPWGWIACEEINEAGHGYAFLCSPDAERDAKPDRLDGYGRFTHEAVGFDPATFNAYMTEDRADGCLYRFVPANQDQPFVGKLWALAVTGRPRLETALDMSPGTRVTVEWVEVKEPAPKEDTVRLQAHELGAAKFRRGEGAFFHAGALYFATTLGGRKDRGQIFKLNLGNDGKADELELLAESPSADVLDSPDNITVAPWGHVLMAEDGADGNFLRGLTPEGYVYDIAFNAGGPGELAGPCFSPDGSALFLNLFLEGKTVAIQGPFSSLGRPA
jgi:secreted PhoX family phosphatase